MHSTTTMNEVPSLFRRRSALSARDPNIPTSTHTMSLLSNPMGEVVDALQQAEIDKQMQKIQRKQQNTERHIQKGFPGLAQAMRTLATPFDPKGQVSRMEKRLSSPGASLSARSQQQSYYASTNDIPVTESQKSSRRSSTNTLKDLLEEKDRELHQKSRLTSAFISSGDSSLHSMNASPPRTQRTTNDKSSLSSFKQTLRQMMHASQVARDDDLDAYVHASEEDEAAADEKPALLKRKSTMYLDDLIQIEAELDKEFGPMDSTTTTAGSYTRSQPASRQLSRRNSFTGIPFSIAAASVPASTTTSPSVNESAGSLSRRSSLTNTLPPPSFSRRSTLPTTLSEKVEQEHKQQEEKTAAPPASAAAPMRTLKDIMGGKFVPTRPTTARTASTAQQQQAPAIAVSADPKPASTTITSRPASAYMRQTQSASMKNKKFLAESNTPPRHHSNKKKTATIARVVDRAPAVSRAATVRDQLSSSDEEEEMAEYLKPIPRMRPLPPTSASNSTSNSSSTASLVNSTSTSPRSSVTQPSSNESSVKSLLQIADPVVESAEDETTKPETDVPVAAADVARRGRQAKQQRRLHSARPSTASSSVSTNANPSPAKAVRSKSHKSGASSSVALSPKKSSSHHVPITQQQSTTSLHSNATHNSASSSSTSTSRLSTAVSSSLKSGGYNSLIDDLVTTEVNELSDHVKQLIRDYNKLHAMGDNKAEQIVSKNRELVQLVGSNEVESSQTSHLTNELQSKQSEFSSLQSEQEFLSIENESLAKAIREEERKTRLQEKTMQNARMLVTQLTTKIGIHTRKGVDAREEAKEVQQETSKLQELLQARQKRNADDLTTQKQHVETLEMLRRARERQKQLEQQVQSETMEQLQQATISPSSSSSNSDRNSDAASPHEPREDETGSSDSPNAVVMDPSQRHSLNVWRSRLHFLHSETGLDDFLSFTSQMEKQPQQHEEAEEQKQQLQMRLAEKQKEQRALAQLLGMNRLAMQKRSNSNSAAPVAVVTSEPSSKDDSAPSLDDLNEVIRRFSSVVQKLAVLQNVTSNRSDEETDEFSCVSHLAAVVDALHE